VTGEDLKFLANRAEPVTGRADRRLDEVHARIRAVRRRRRTAVATAAAAAVLVSGSVYGVLKIEPGTTNEPAGKRTIPSMTPSTTPSTTLPTTSWPYPAPGTSTSVVPGTYEYLVDPDYIWPIHADFTFYAPWKGGIPPQFVSNTGSRGGLDLYLPDALAAGTGCLNGDVQPHTNLGHTPQVLAQQLAHLPHSTLLQGPAPEHMFGSDGFHLRLRINDTCGADVYGVAHGDGLGDWTTLQLGHGNGHDADTQILIDFWVQDFDGAPVVVETWHQDDAPAEMVDQITKTRDSIKFLRE